MHLLIIAGLAHAAPTPDVAPANTYIGPDAVEVNLLRTMEGGPRIYVQATLPDGEPGLFMVDTGAATSVLSEKTAERLGLELWEDWGTVEGIGGRTNYDRAVIPTLVFNDAIVPEVEVAVGVRGVQDTAGLMPLDGILGNNVWQRFTMEIDYPADLLVLHRPGTVKRPKNKNKWETLYFDGDHIWAPIEVTTATEPPLTQEVFIQVDTGASELLLSGAAGRGFTAYTEGEEPLFGIGASEYMPTLFHKTRRIPLEEVDFGGRRVDVDFEARWINYEGSTRKVGPSGMQGLAGHELMADHNVVFAYQDGWFAMRKSKRKERLLDGHAVLLQQDIDRYGVEPSRYLFRAKMMAMTGDEQGAIDLLKQYVDAHPEDSEARVLLAGVYRLQGDLEGAWTALEPLGPKELVEEGQITASVNGLLLDGHVDEAEKLARAALAEMPEQAADGRLWANAWIALADTHLAKGEVDEANRALLKAASLVQNPDAFLMRRARVALASGDRNGAVSRIRKLLQLYPSGGQFLWFYATLVEGEADSATFRRDMNEAVGRLHPRMRPLDFMVAAYHGLGEQDQSSQLMREGIERDCQGALDESSKDNCLAWYYSLNGVEPADALTRITRALDAEGDRSDFLDTKAMVHLARGEFAAAHEAAVAAARLSPDDVYMLWQAERIGDIARERTHQSASTRGEVDAVLHAPASRND